MNEPFDVEISRALKNDAAESLEGWEFSPAMRAKVMDRIRSEAGTAAPESPSSRRFDMNRVVRPLAWAAVAAAAMMIAINTDLPRMGSSKTEAPQMASAPAATADNARSFEAAAPAPEPVAAAKPAEAAQSTGAVTTTMTAKAAEVRESGVVAFELLAPVPVADAAGGPLATLTAPSQPKMGIMAMSASNIGGAVPADNGEVLTLSPLGVKKVDLNNAIIWERTLADLSPQSLIATAPDGRSAVANGGNVLYLLNEQGELDRTILSTGPISQVAWSNDGRVASAEGSMVFVYAAATGEKLYSVDNGPEGQVAFTPDGVLAVYSRQSTETPTLKLLTVRGALITKAHPAVAGAGLAVVADGEVIVAGGQAYDKAGKPLWQLPLTTEGLAGLGTDRLVAWDAHTVMTVGARTGAAEGWKAEWQGKSAISRVVPSPDGRFVAILAQAEDGGAVLWVVTRDGKALLTEKLPQMPAHVGFAGAQVILVQEGAVEYRTIPE